MNIKFAISTNTSYMNQTLPVLFDSVKQNKIKNDQVIVFVNESTYDGIDVVDEVTYHHSKDTTYFEWLIPKLIIERELKSDWWFLLHDTVVLGETFYQKVMNHDNKDKNIITVTSINNIGMLKQEVFTTHKKYFTENIKTLSDLESSLERKKWIVDHENEYFRLEDYIYFYGDSSIYNNYSDVVCYDTMRDVEYFRNVDLYKFKRNNGRTSMSVNL